MYCRLGCHVFGSAGLGQTVGGSKAAPVHIPGGRNNESERRLILAHMYYARIYNHAVRVR